MNADKNVLGKILALAVIISAGIWVGRIYTGGESYCPFALITGHCPLQAGR